MIEVPQEHEAEIKRHRDEENSFRRGGHHAAEAILGVALAQRGNGEDAILSAVEEMTERILEWRNDNGPQPF